MGDFIDFIYGQLAAWDRAYADRWRGFMRSTTPHHEDVVPKVCQFWQLELSVLDRPDVRELRTHLTPTNHLSVLMQIFSQQVLPLLDAHPSTFRHLSHAWGTVY